MSKSIRVVLTGDASRLTRALIEAEANVRYPLLYRVMPKAAVAAVEFEHELQKMDAIFKAKP